MIVAMDTKAALGEAREQYAAHNPRSFALYSQACSVMPGGSTRTALFYQPFPLVMVRGRESRLWDADGREYIDFLGEYTAGLYGHSSPAIRAAIERALEGGVVLGGHSPLEAQLAGMVCARFPSIDYVRFTNSGTEANLMAISAAIAITGRRKLLVFDGAYHGGLLSFSNGSAPVNAPYQFLVSSYNDLGRTMSLLEENADDLAAVLIEPMLGAGGCIPAEVSFLEEIRRATRKHGVILIFDEVMTSRLSGRGLQGMYDILPDMTTLGKYIGGGLTCGAFGGSAELMRRFDNRNPQSFSHAGTFNNNVLTMSAGIAGLSLYTPALARQIDARGNWLRRKLNALAQQNDVALQFTGIGSMLNAHLCSGPICNPSDAAKADRDLSDLLFFDLVSMGFWFAKRGMIVLSLPITDDDCEQLVIAVQEFIDRRRALLRKFHPSASLQITN